MRRSILRAVHHAAAGGAAVVFVRIATPREVGGGGDAYAGPGELGRTGKIAEEQVYGTLYYLIGLHGYCSE